MTDAQRRAINRHNAQKSTGPITPEGKERSRQNALKHGLCAAQLALSIEDADELQEQFDGWIDQYQPVGPAEFAMVEEIARSHLKLRRCAGREAAVVKLQILAASRAWCHEQEDRVAALTPLFATDPARALRELSRFGSGRQYLRDRWERLGRWFLKDECCNVPALVDEAVRLLGGDPQQLATSTVVAYHFAICCAGARSTRDPAVLDRLFSDAVMHPEYLAEIGRALLSPEGCRDEVRRIVTQQFDTLDQIEVLEKHTNGGQTYELVELTALTYSAQIPAAGPATAQALRYETAARSALHKAERALDRLQNERFAVEAAAEQDAARNEADTPPESPPNPDSTATCDASEDTHPDVPSAGGMPTETRACNDHEDMPTQTRACQPSNVLVVTLEGPDSPPA